MATSGRPAPVVLDIPADVFAQFAARCLVERWQREDEGLLRPLLHDPRWTEVILLAAGRLGEFSAYQVTRFLAAILGAESPWEPILHRDLMLAARSLADDIPVDAPLRRQVVTRLVELYFSPGTRRR